jgi:small-conductance mechanosensitive channel
MAALEMLNILEGFGLKGLGHNSTAYLHHLIEAKKLAFADLHRWLADPEKADLPVTQIISKPYAEQQRKRIEPHKAAPKVESEIGEEIKLTERGDTVYLTVVDKDRNAVSFINSLSSAFGSGVVVPGTGFLYIIAIGWLLYNLAELIDFALRRLTAKTAAKLDDAVVTLLRKALRIFLLIMMVLFVAENIFGADITAWLAGLGIAGLAVSLAAQDSIKNLFGSVTILMEHPFGVGDRIIFENIEGFVEDIGFRSTKIRNINGHLLTVPNMKFTDGVIENISARPWARRSMNVTVTYDTPPEKLEEAVTIIKSILAEPEIAKDLAVPDRPARVMFNEFNADSLNIMVSYFYLLNVDGRDWWTYQALAAKVNHRILVAFNAAGIQFAFPTRTVFLAGDPDRELTVRVKGAADSLE